jgi:hypothetical protein
VLFVGWALVVTNTGASYLGWPFLFAIPGSSIRYGALALNIAAGAILLGGTAFAVERWLSASRPFQVDLRTLIVLIAVAAALLAWQRFERTLEAPDRESPLVDSESVARFDRGNLILVPTSESDPLLLSVPIYVGMGCTIYAAGWLMIAGVKRGFGLSWNLPH